MVTDIEVKFGDAAYAYTCGNFATAAAMFSECAALGHGQSATYLGQMYLAGDGVPADAEKAVEFLERAMALGDWNGAWTLAAAFYSGHHGVPCDVAKSRHYYSKAKDLGCPLTIDDFSGDGS